MTLQQGLPLPIGVHIAALGEHQKRDYGSRHWPIMEAYIALGVYFSCEKVGDEKQMYEAKSDLIMYISQLDNMK